MIDEHSPALVFPPFEDQSPHWIPGEGLPEIHLYFGSRCNRECDFCVVFGSPRGWMAAVDEELLEALLGLLHPQAQLKIYGGEPTLLAANLRWVFAQLRRRGFAGRFTLFSNGIQSARLLELLEADANSCCVLNYSILTGIHAEPIPPVALRQLTEYARRHPGRIFAGHPDLVEVGRAQQWGREQLRQRTDFDHTCPRCFPVVTTRGRYHACPFAVENNSPQYDLGDRVLNGAFHETLLALDDQDHIIRYSIDDGPGAVSKSNVQGYLGEVRLFPVTENNSTLVLWTSSWETSGGGVSEFCDPVYKALLGDLKKTFS